MRLSCISKQNEQKMSHSLSKIFCQIKFVIWGGGDSKVFISARILEDTYRRLNTIRPHHSTCICVFTLTFLNSKFDFGGRK